MPAWPVPSGLVSVHGGSAPAAADVLSQRLSIGSWAGGGAPPRRPPAAGRCRLTVRGADGLPTRNAAGRGAEWRVMWSMGSKGRGDGEFHAEAAIAFGRHPGTAHDPRPSQELDPPPTHTIPSHHHHKPTRCPPLSAACDAKTLALCPRLGDPASGPLGRLRIAWALDIDDPGRPGAA
eukprot:gene25426-61503_t